MLRMLWYLMCGAHQNVVGDLAERQSQVDDIILRAAAFRKVADVNNSAGRHLSGQKWLQVFEKYKYYFYVHTISSAPPPPTCRHMRIEFSDPCGRRSISAPPSPTRAHSKQLVRLIIVSRVSDNVVFAVTFSAPHLRCFAPTVFLLLPFF